ncbi:hypothetical protein KP509_1Z063400 [Ceratopteris richardii]|nr:hypothetical protein KP509_1Z063400 [Ceratopteris richardii]
MNDYEKVIEACNNVIRIFQSKGDLTHLADYIRRLAKAHAALQDYQNALHAWENILHMESVSNSLRLEALCGVVDSKYILMEQWIEKNTNLQLSQDKMLDASSAKQIAENQFTNSQDGLDLEETLWGLLKEIPTNEKYETILLQYLIWKMRVKSGTNAACSEMGMLELAQGRMTRLNYLGKRLVHAYPDQVLLMPVLAYLMHQSSSCSRSLLQKRSLCERAIQLNENSVLGWQVLAELWASEGAYSNANDCIRRGLHAINELRSSFGLSLQCAEMELRLAFGEIHLKTGNYDEASKVYHNIINVAEQKKDDKFTQVLVPAKEGQIKVLLAQGHVEEAANGLIALLSLDNQNSWALAEQGYLAYEKKDFEKAGTLLQQAVTLNPTCAKYHHRLGLVYWNLNNAKEKALSHFMESAKLDPNQSEVFCMLGHYYKDFPVSRGRAIRCYQKAITVNCEDSEAGEALCDLLDSESQEISEVNICQEASGRSPRAFWAFRRLGYIQVSRKEWTEAVKNLQHAVRGYPASPDLWEALGLAYQQLGMLTAALKAYGRVLTINEGSLYALQQSGNILQTLGMYRKAVSMFQDAVEKSPEHPASLYGLASALHSQAHECRSKGAVQWSASLLKEASLVASRGLSICRNIGCFWKLLGDIEISYARNLPWELKQCVLDEDRISRTIDQSKILHSFALSLNAWREERLSAALKSKRAYQHALHLQPHKAYIYADLCSCLHYIANLTDDKKSKCSILTESMAYNGLAVDGNNTNLWTLLGIVSKNHAIQQHAFIQALHVDGNHALAWAKLGQVDIGDKYRIYHLPCIV